MTCFQIIGEEGFVVRDKQVTSSTLDKIDLNLKTVDDTCCINSC